MDIPLQFEFTVLRDTRGSFKKILDQNNLKSQGIDSFLAMEMFTSETAQFAARGMHIQSGPVASRKIVWVTEGEIIDVLVCVLPGENYGKVYVYELKAENHKALHVPAGYAHGFQALSRVATVNYLTDEIHHEKYDIGFHLQSFGFSWPEPISSLSQRDKNLPLFQDFK